MRHNAERRLSSAVPLLAVSALVAAAMTACTLLTLTASPADDSPAGGAPAPAGPTPPAAPTPAPAPTEPGESSKSWTISADDFGGSTRSARYAWDEITADNADLVQVSIGGQEVPFTSTASRPAFAADASGAQWTVTAQAAAGEVVLTLTAPDQRRSEGQVRSVTITNAGSGYTSNPTVTLVGEATRAATGEARIDGRVTAVTMTAGGSGYTTNPTVTFTATTHEQRALGFANLDGQVGRVSVSDAGVGYSSVPGVRLVSRDSGSGAAATVVADGQVASVTVTDRGRYFGTNNVPTVVFSEPWSGGTRATAQAQMRTAGVGREVSGVTINERGSGYRSAATITFTGDPLSLHGLPGRRAAASLRMRYTVDSVRLTNRGSGYASAPTVRFDPPQSGVFFGVTLRTAAATAVLDFYVKSVTIDSPGSYQSAPAVTFSGGGGSGAAATATIAGGVGSVEIVDPGSGYTTPPSVTFAGGGGSGAAATATVATRTSGRSRADNLNSALRTLDGKELVVRFGDEETS